MDHGARSKRFWVTVPQTDLVDHRRRRSFLVACTSSVVVQSYICPFNGWDTRARVPSGKQFPLRWSEFEGFKLLLAYLLCYQDRLHVDIGGPDCGLDRYAFERCPIRLTYVPEVVNQKRYWSNFEDICQLILTAKGGQTLTDPKLQSASGNISVINSCQMSQGPAKRSNKILSPLLWF